VYYSAEGSEGGESEEREKEREEKVLEGRADCALQSSIRDTS